MKKLLITNNKIVLKNNGILLHNNIRRKIKHTTTPESNSLTQGGAIIGHGTKPYRLMGNMVTHSGTGVSHHHMGSINNDLSRLNFSSKSKSKNVRLRQ